MADKRVLEVIQSEFIDDDTTKTFVLNGEDHTLGNSLRYMIMKNPEIKFCGYAVPHPSENKINLRIQTYGSSATDQFRKGLEDLNQLCEILLEKFQNITPEDV
ncbi:uncharacterized protein Polr1D [Centruroides vittatus]|uniref:uncharacterized protein Polr1D n=1 Tax=Centruroides vittatus TaxID=120091 RepID=UPI00350F353C